MRIAINGFGRIGRSIFRIATENNLNVVAINDIHGSEDAAYLLKYDSTYGKYPGEIKFSKNEIVVKGKKIKVLSETNPLKLPWNDMKVDIVIESTGAFRNPDDALKHIEVGAKYVLITAPAKKGKPDLTLVPGVNHNKLNKKCRIISVASCTTNCLAPVMKVLEEDFGVKRALMTTIHSYTSSQALVDGFNKDRRRGRAAALNMIPTTTGASEAVTEVIPSLRGKLTGMAVRIPLAVGSLIDVVAELNKKFDTKKINLAFSKASREKLKGILNYTEEEIVSSDIEGDKYSAIVDGLSTMQNGNLVKVLAWYDNEFGYSNRVVDVVKMLKKFVK